MTSIDLPVQTPGPRLYPPIVRLIFWKHSLALLHSDTPQELKYADTLQSVTHTITIKIAAHFFLLFQNIFDNFFVRVDKKTKNQKFKFKFKSKKKKRKKF